MYLCRDFPLSDETKSHYENHLKTLSVQGKFNDSAKLESTCGSWKRLLSGFHPWQLSFLLRVSSDTLPTEVNLHRWKTQCSAQCVLCNSTRPTTAHILSGCPVALTQNQYIYRHNLALQCVAHQFIDIFEHLPFIHVFADLPNLQASVSPPATIPPEVMPTSYRPDLVFYNTTTTLLELTCSLDSIHHLESARSRKQNKLEYQQLLADFSFKHYYYKTLEISVLYHPFCVTNLLNLLRFVHHAGFEGIQSNREENSGFCLSEMYYSFSENIYG